jgi:hypothetical protein
MADDPNAIIQFIPLHFTSGAQGKGRGLQPGSPPPQTEILKNSDFPDMLSSFLRDLPFS